MSDPSAATQKNEHVDHLKVALKEASAEPGATIKPLGAPVEHGAPSEPLAAPPSAELLTVSPSATGPSRADVVEAVGLKSGAEIRSGLAHGFGASAGPVRSRKEEGEEEGGKVMASAAEQGKKEEGKGESGGAM
jgi:hypothetical protein